MANNLSARIDADISGFVSRMTEAGRATKKQTDMMASEFAKVGKVIDDNAAKIAKSSQTFSAEFSKASKQVQDLVKKALESGVKPKFKEMEEFLKKQGVSIVGLGQQKLVSDFSKHLANEFKRIQQASTQTKNVIMKDVREWEAKMRQIRLPSNLGPPSANKLGSGRGLGFGAGVLGGLPPAGSGGGSGGGDSIPPIPPGSGGGGRLLGGVAVGTLVRGALFTAVGAAAIPAALAIKKFTDEVAASQDRLEDMSRTVNITVETLSALEHVAIMNGTTLEEMQRSFMRLNDQMQEAASGNSKRAVEMFRELGVKVTDAAGKVRPTMHVFLDMADSLEAMGETSKRTSLIMDMFGTVTGGKILKIMKDGSMGIKEAMQQAIDMGLVLTKEEQKMAAGYNKEVRLLGEQWRMFKKIIGIEVMPLLTSFISKINELIGAIRRLNQSNFVQGIKSFGTALGQLYTGNALGAGKTLIDNFKRQWGIGQPDPTHMFPDESLTEGRGVDKLLAGETGSDVRMAGNKWTDMLEDMKRNFREQLNAIKEQEIAMKKGGLAAKEWAMDMKFAEDRQKAIKDGIPNKQLAEMTKIFNDMKPKILAAQDAFDKLMGKDFASEIKERTRSLRQGVEQIKDTMSDLLDSADPGEKAFRGFTKQLEGAEKQIEDMLVTARREARLGVVPGAVEQVRELEDALQRIQELLASDSMRKFDFGSKILDDLKRTQDEIIKASEFELQMAQAISQEDRVRVEVNRTLAALKKQGVSNEQLQSEELREQLTLHERIKQSIQEQIKFTEAMRGRRQNIEDMMVQIQMNAAITKDDRLQVELLKARLDLERQHVTITQERLDELNETVKVQHEISEIIRRQADEVDTIMKSIDSAIENMQTSFADMWYNIFDPEQGENFGKNFLRSVAQGWLRATSQFAGVMMNKLMEDIFQSLTGSSGGIREGIMELMKGWFNIGKLSEQDAATVSGAQGWLSNKRTPEMLFADSVMKFSGAVEALLSGIDAGKYSGPGAGATYDDFGFSEAEADLGRLMDDFDAGSARAAGTFASILRRGISQIQIPGLSGGGSGGSRGLLGMFLGSLFKGITGSIGGWFGGGLMGTDALVAGGHASDLLDMGYASGGYASTGLSGIVDKPLVTMGENAPGHMEAVVPLPDNRSIPVRFTGGGDGGGMSPTVMPTPVQVNFLGDMVDPAYKGMTPEETIEVVYANMNQQDGKLRQAVRNEFSR